MTLTEPDGNGERTNGAVGRPPRGAVATTINGVIVVACYAALAVWLTWPLASRLTTDLPLTMASSLVDAPLAAWAAAHETRALLSSPSSLPDAGIYYPTPHSLFYAETGFGALPLFAPVFLATGDPTLAINLVFLVGVVLTASAIHVVTRRSTGSDLGGVIAGLTFLTTPWVLWSFVPTAANYAVLFYLPFIIWLVIPPTPTWRTTIGVAFLVALQGLTSVYVAFATMAPLAVLGAARCLRPATRIGGLRLFAALAMASVLLVPPYWGYLQVKRANPGLANQSVYAGQRLLHTSLPLVVSQTIRPTALPSVAWILMVGGLLARRRAATAEKPSRRRDGWRHAGFWTLAGLYFSLTPIIEIGAHQIPLPHVVMAPLYDALRVSFRLGVTTLIAGSMLAGIAFVECTARIRGRHASFARIGCGVVVTGVLLLTYFRPMTPQRGTLDPRAAYPTFRAPVAEGPIFDAVANAPGALLEIPIGPSTVAAAAMYRSIRHRHPLVNGYSGYWPAEFPQWMALACRLPDPVALADLVRATNVRMILVHARSVGLERRATLGSIGPYRCPPLAVEPQPGWEEKAWVEASVPGRRPDLRLLRRDPNGDLLFAVTPADAAPSPAAAALDGRSP